MTVLTFPSSPIIGQRYNAPNEIQYVFDGVKWIVESSSNTSEAISNSTQDRVAPMFVDGDNTGITFTYNAATNVMSAAVNAVNGNQLVNGSHTLSLGSTGNTTFPTGLVLGAPRGSGTVNFTSAIDKEFQIETGTASYSKLWRFETNGNTTLPTGLTFRKNGTPYSTITADLDKVLQIETQTSGGVKQWSFGTDGKLTAPGNLQVDGGKIILNTGGNAYIESVDYGVNSANSAVNIFGGPYQKIKLRAGFGTEAAWTFGTDGVLTLPPDGTISNTVDGIKLETNRGTLAIGTNMEAPGVAQHFHIAFDGSNSNPNANDLFLGDDYNYVKLPGDELNITNPYGVEIGTQYRGGPQNVAVTEVDELVPPGGVWRLFISDGEYPNLGATVSVGDPVDIAWGSQISATITEINQFDGDWQIQVDQDITAGFDAGPKTVSFGSQGNNYKWRFETDGSITFPDATVQTTAYTGQADINLLSSPNSIEVETGDSDRWFVRLRREDETQDPQFKGVTVYSTNYDSAGNAIVVARIKLDNDGVAVFKFTSAGDLVWKKSMGSINNSSYTYPESNVVIDTSDNILFAINQDNFGEKVIIKLSGATGAVLFSKVLALTQDYHIKGMALDSANNIIIGGDFYFSGPDEWTGFVAKLNPNANSIIWQKSLTVDSGYSKINSVAVDFNNNIIAVGAAEVEHTVNGATLPAEEMLVAKITSVGGLGWQKSVSIASETPYGTASNVSLDSVGNIYVTGTYYVDNVTNSTPWTGQKSNAVVLFKMTTLGVIAWDRRVGPGECSWVGVSTAVGDDGDLYLYASTYQLNPAGQTDSALGYWNATLALARYNKTTGAVVWQSYFDNPNAQEIPGEGNDSPFNYQFTDLMAVKGNKILIGGSVRLGADGASLISEGDTDHDYFTQGFIAQFDTAATPWSAEGWTLSTSRIPGRLMNTLTAVTGPTALQTDIAMTAEGAVMLSAVAVGVSVRRTASKVNTWTFGKDGTFSAPADANIKLNQRQLGYATMYGVFDNDNDDIWFETVCHDADGFAYAVGSDWYGPGDRAHIYKFTPEGAAVWQRQLRSGSGAQFEVVVTSGVYAVPTVTSGGEDYKVGDRIILSGYNLGGNASNTLVLEVATITNDIDYVGEVATVTIVSGVGASGVTNTFNSVQDYYDDAECEVRSMAYNPVTGNIEVIITTQTTLGDPIALNLDIDWSETVIVTIDSDSGTVVSTRTLRDEGDVYAYDTAVSSTGKIAVVGEKFNEYTEYGSITPLAGSAVDKLWVSKADIDAEHFPGESIPGGSYYQDWWITGTGITDQIRVTGVNYYTGLATSSNSVDGRDATISVEFDATTGGWSTNTSVVANGVDYSAGDTITISGLLLAGGTTPANDIVFTVNSVLAGGGVNTGSISWTSGAHPSTHLQITTSASVNFAAGGAAFAIKQNLGGEAFVWTPDFTKAIGGAVSDVFSGVVWNAAGTSLYAVGRGHYEVNYNQALVVKFSSTGTVTASKFINDNMGENNAYDGAVALMANDSIVVVHDQYNNERDEDEEVLVTKLDSSLNIVWQQFIGVNTDPNGNNWYSPLGKISVAVDPATDEILLAWHTYNNDIFGDDAIYLVKLDTDGEVIWKRIWGVHESDTRMCYTGYGNKALSIHGDQFTLVGYTDAPDDNQDNGFIVTLPLDGTGLGEHGIWTYVEPKDDIVKVWRLSGRTATVFTATEHTGGITAVANIKHYYTDYPSEEFTFYPETILSNQGGAVEFADGSRQTFSTALVPQVKISAGRYTLRPEDSGRHILIESSNYSVIIPNWQKAVLPVGYTVTLVNISGSDAYVQCEGSDNYRGEMWFSGGDDKTPAIRFPDNGSGQMITLIKIKEGTKSDDAEDHGDIWMVAGAEIYNND